MTKRRLWEFNSMNSLLTCFPSPVKPNGSGETPFSIYRKSRVLGLVKKVPDARQAEEAD